MDLADKSLRIALVENVVFISINTRFWCIGVHSWGTKILIPEV